MNPEKTNQIIWPRTVGRVYKIVIPFSHEDSLLKINMAGWK
jgi:hypothetical protein